jgi:hypothetical protein
MICPECGIGIIIDAPRINLYELNNEPVCNHCGLTQDLVS